MDTESDLMAENLDKTFAIYTLGCKVNQEESAAIANVFAEHGWRQVPFGEAAAVTVINTCTVTQIAEKKSRNILRRAQAANPQTFLAATGCYVQMKPDEAAKIDGVDLLLGANEKDLLFGLASKGAALKQKTGSVSRRRQVSDARSITAYREIGNINSRTERTRAFVKIEDGCNQFCTYCIVPYVRGPVRSRPAKAVLDEIAALAEAGYREVVLTGIHTGAYGRELGEEDAFASLVAQAAAVKGLKRLRLGSIEPHELSGRLLALMAENPVICPHFHIPLQAAADEVLRAMGRTYDMAFYFDLVGRIRAALPQAAITTDIIAGFPGETDALFAEGLENIKRLAFADAHIFPYSRRPGTPAAALPGQVLNAEKNARAARIAKAVAESRRAFRGRVLGRQIEFLAERVQLHNGKRGAVGYTADYLPVFAEGISAEPGELLTVRAKGLTPDDEILAGAD